MHRLKLKFKNFRKEELQKKNDMAFSKKYTKYSMEIFGFLRQNKTLKLGAGLTGGLYLLHGWKRREVHIIGKGPRKDRYIMEK